MIGLIVVTVCSGLYMALWMQLGISKVIVASTLIYGVGYYVLNMFGGEGASNRSHSSTSSPSMHDPTFVNIPELDGK